MKETELSFPPLHPHGVTSEDRKRETALRRDPFLPVSVRGEQKVGSGEVAAFSFQSPG